MAKGQQRGNKEEKKPKKSKTTTAPATTFVKLPKAAEPHKQK